MLRLALAMAEEAQIVGRNIKRYRTAQRLTQREVAEKIPGSTQGADVSRWERGQHLPIGSTREHLAKALGVTLGDLYVRDDPEDATNGTDRASQQPNGQDPTQEILRLLTELGQEVGALQDDVRELKRRLPESGEASSE